MSRYGLGRRCHDRKNILKLDFHFKFLEFIINLRSSLQKFVEKHRMNVILPCFKQILDHYMSVYLLAHCLHYLLEYVDISRNVFCQHGLFGFVDQCVFSNVYDYSFTKFKFII